MSLFVCRHCSGKWWAYDLLLSLGGEIFAAEVRHCGLVWAVECLVLKKSRFGL